jgi:alpha-amylase
VTGLFNYPMFFTIKDVFGAGKSMYQIRTTYDSEEEPFKDIEALGSFMDNHDNARFLSQYDNWTGFKSAITFALTARGIPFFYYGDEQGYRGGNDPANRESLWDHMDTNTEVYQMVAKINAARKSAQIWNYPYVERYVLDNFFAFSKGNMVVMTTNSTNRVDVRMPYLPYTVGTEVCNIFRGNDECQTVNDQGMSAVLENGESKIWLPKDSSYFKAQAREFLN